MFKLKSIIFLILVCISFLVSGNTVLSQVFSNSAVADAHLRLNKMAPGIVKIWVSCSGQSPWEGAGVVINDKGHILTAAHVGNACIGKPSEVWVGVPKTLYGVPTKTHQADLIERFVDGKSNPTLNESLYAKKHDLALYKLRAGQTPLKPAKIAKTPVIAGDEIHIVGFSNLPFKTALETTSAGISVYRTTLASVAADNEIPFRLHYGGGTWEGMSGGPVYNSDNELVGIHSTRSSLNVVNLLNEKCDPKLGDCFGNSIGFDYRDATGAVKRQVINVDYSAVKSILDNNSWATSINAIPQSWSQQF